MIRVSKGDLEKIRLEVDQLMASAFWMETYSLGLWERCKKLKQKLLDLERVGTIPDTKPITE